MAEVTTAQIRARFEEVNALIERHQLALIYLEKERDELEVAVRVIERFDERPDFSSSLLVDMSVAMGAATAAIAASKKPTGIPTMPEMILEALETAYNQGKAGLRPKDILKFIRETYWPDAPSDSVGPVAWRMWSKERRIAKGGDLYFIDYSNETPAVTAAGASEPEEEGW